MFKLTIALLKYFGYFAFGIFLAFPISALCGAIASPPSGRSFGGQDRGELPPASSGSSL